MVTAVGLCRRDIVMAYRALEHPTVGWIGAGRMGLQMASKLLDAGYDVAIYNRTASKAAPMIILEQARRSDITLATENVKVDDGLEASS
jgi:6-phosphogluconate dehydrogenase